MKQGMFRLLSNECIAQDVYRMEFSGDASEITTPGQFVNIKIDGFYLRRPISVCDFTQGSLTLICKSVGRGTQVLCRLKSGAQLDMLTGLGNGFDTKKSGDSPLLLGGGVGSAPMYALCKKLVNEGKRPSVILGFAGIADVFYEEEFKSIGADVYVTTADGSYGTRGFVTDIMGNKPYSFFYACGPEPMLKAIGGKALSEGQYSFEERMGCGFGACMGCSCKTLAGNKRICKDGPVMESGDIVWGD